MTKHEIMERLGEIVKPEAIAKWMKKPNAHFGGKTPQEILESDDTSKLEEMIYRMGSGEPG